MMIKVVVIGQHENMIIKIYVNLTIHVNMMSNVNLMITVNSSLN